ncbi:MAG: PKD domain-containing protein [Bacteroidota bacterium]
MKTLLLSAIALCFSLCSYSAENLKAKIEANKQTGFLPLNVRFACPEQTSDVVYFWDFGNGSTSFDRTPQNMFVNPGTYKVKLVVKDRFETDSSSLTIDVLPNNELINHLSKVRAGMQ